MSCGLARERVDGDVPLAVVDTGTSKSSGSQNMFIMTCRSARAAEAGDRAGQRPRVRIVEARAVQRRAVPRDVGQAALVDLRPCRSDGCQSAGCALRKAIIR